MFSTIDSISIASGIAFAVLAISYVVARKRYEQRARRPQRVPRHPIRLRPSRVVRHGYRVAS
jgi:hypothetical protein